MLLTVRPLDQFPGIETSTWARRHGPFGRVTWDSTLAKLERELDALAAYNVVLLMDVAESDLRLNGSIRAGAQPATPRVVIGFECKHGPLKYGCDAFHDWRDNVRAIAHGLEALRKLERYGIASRGEQYTGWKALGTGLAMGPGMTRSEAAKLIADLANDLANDAAGDPAFVYANDILEEPALRAAAYRVLAKVHHPDVGGDPALFARITEARDVLAEPT